MLRGLCTVNFFAEDHAAAAKWYSELFGVPPYYDSAVVYWHVDAIAAALQRVLALGATEHAPITKQGDGFITASVVDPFGNVLGLMYNQHYLDILAKRT